MFIHLLLAVFFLVVAYQAAPKRHDDLAKLLVYWIGLVGFATEAGRLVFS